MALVICEDKQTGSDFVPSNGMHVLDPLTSDKEDLADNDRYQDNKRKLTIPLLHQIPGKRYDGPLLHRIIGKRSEELGDSNESFINNMINSMDVGGFESKELSEDKREPQPYLYDPLLHSVLGRHSQFGMSGPLLHSLPGKKNNFYLRGPSIKNFNGPLLHTMLGKRYSGPLLHTMLGKRPNGELFHTMLGEQLDGNSMQADSPTKRSYPYYPILHSLPGKRFSYGPLQNMLHTPWSRNFRPKAASKKASMFDNYGPLLHMMAGKRYGYDNAPLLHAIMGKRDSEAVFQGQTEVNDITAENIPPLMKRSVREAEYPIPLDQLVQHDTLDTELQTRMASRKRSPELNNGEPVFGADDVINMYEKRSRQSNYMMLNKFLRSFVKGVDFPRYVTAGSETRNGDGIGTQNNYKDEKEVVRPRSKESAAQYGSLLHYLGGFGKRAIPVNWNGWISSK